MVVTKEDGRVVLTNFGNQIYPDAKRAVWNIRTILSKANHQVDICTIPATVNVGIGYVPLVSISATPEQVGKMKALFPKTKFNITYQSNETCFAGLEKGLFDICFVCGVYSDVSLEFCQLRIEKPVVAMQSSNALRQKEHVSLMSLAEKTIATPDDLNHHYPELVDAFSVRGIPLPHFESIPLTLDAVHTFLTNDGLMLIDSETSKLSDLLSDVEYVDIADDDVPDIIVSIAYKSGEGSAWKKYLSETLKLHCFVNHS